MSEPRRLLLGGALEAPQQPAGGMSPWTGVLLYFFIIYFLFSWSRKKKTLSICFLLIHTQIIKNMFSKNS
jgi:hypothetical protein